MEHGEKGGTVQSLDRALMLLKLVANCRNGISLPELIDKTGLNRTTIWRLLLSLEENGFIERDSVTKNYFLGYCAAALCNAAANRYEPLIRICRPVMQKIWEETQESVLLTVPKYGGILTIDQIDSPHAICIKNYVNVVSPLYCSSNGKLYLSSLSELDCGYALQEELVKYTDKTIVDRKALLEEIRVTGKRGYGIVEGDLDDHENGLSVGLDDGTGYVAFLNLSGPSNRFTRAVIDDYAPTMLAHAAEVSRRLQRLKAV